MAGVKMGTVWDRTSDFVADNLSRILPVALVAFFIPFSITGNLSPLLDQADMRLSLVLLLVMVALSVLALWGSLALTAMVVRPNGDAPRTALRCLGPALLVWLLLFVLLAALVAPLGIGLALAGIDPTGIRPMPGTVSIGAGLGWAMALYFLAMLAVSFWLSARLALINSAIVGDRLGIGAIGRSFRLTAGLSWRLMGVGILYIIVSNVAALAAQTVFGSVLALIMEDAAPFSLASILTSIAVAAVQTGFCVLAPLFTAMLYLGRVPEHGAA
ncbi:hypothetical protein TPR58_19175 [Sphingomonas sp. HF-S3]|uniref:Glycerophosphoryl diester phosphodiesterase membrane domain-containing protein n=1 Tax=Sphingomonas rustica TaxID=3103142 RepID=A0ABV0BCQ7_9SPHN